MLATPAYIPVQHPTGKPASMHSEGPHMELQPGTPKPASSRTSQPISEITGCCKEGPPRSPFSYWRKKNATDVLTCLLSFPSPTAAWGSSKHTLPGWDPAASARGLPRADIWVRKQPLYSQSPFMPPNSVPAAPALTG